MTQTHSPRRALVLGCGAVAGGAWSIATLHHLEQQLQWDARNADILVGTSVGAVLASLLGAGVSVDTLLACQQGNSQHCQWDHDHDSGGAFPPLPAARFTGLKLLQQGLRRQISPLTAMAGLCPQGRTDMTPFRRLISQAVGNQRWVAHPATWLMAVNAETGKRVAFGRGDAPSAEISDAVCASYAVPACCPPVTIGQQRYIDGGVASPTSADLLADSGVDEVIILAPMASRQRDRSKHPLTLIERQARRYMTAIVDREEALLRKAGKRVIRLEPGPTDLQAFGYNLLDPKRRQQVLDTALRTGESAVRQALAD